MIFNFIRQKPFLVYNSNVQLPYKINNKFSETVCNTHKNEEIINMYKVSATGHIRHDKNMN